MGTAMRGVGMSMRSADVLFTIVPIILPIFVMFVFILAIASIFSPKFRGKMMSKEVKARRYMIDEVKDDIESISTNMADASKEGIKITTSAIKEGFSERESIFCKHCGSRIDADSKFCKSCGKEQ